jgi:hypothetical protein
MLNEEFSVVDSIAATAPHAILLGGKFKHRSVEQNVIPTLIIQLVFIDN